MRNQRFQSKVTAGRFTLPAAILITIICWIVAAPLYSHAEVPMTAPQWLCNLTTETFPHWLVLLISFILHGAIAFFLINLNNTFALIRVRASIQSAIYFLLTGACPFAHGTLSGLLCTVCYLIAIQLLFASYREERTSSQLFHSFALAGIAGIIAPPYMLLAPLLWIGASSFYALNARSLAASVVGFAFPWWLLLGYATLTGNLTDFFQRISEIQVFQPIGIGFEAIPGVSLLFLFLLFTVSAVHCIVAGYEDKIRTRTYLYFLSFFGLCLYIYVFLQPFLFVSFCPILLCITSILAGHLFALTNSRLSNAFFIFSLTGTLALFIFNLIWTLL